MLTPGGGGTQYKSGYRDVPQTWVAKSCCQVHQWVPFFSKMRYMDGCACFNRYIVGPFFIIEVHRWAIFLSLRYIDGPFFIIGTLVLCVWGLN